MLAAEVLSRWIAHVPSATGKIKSHISHDALSHIKLYCLALCWSNRGLLNIGFILRKYNLRDIF